MQRRRVIFAIPAALAFANNRSMSAALQTRGAQRYSYAGLVEEASKLAAADYAPPPTLAGDVLQRIDYETLGQIRYNPDRALFLHGPGPCRITFFHLGHLFRTPVRMFVVQEGQASEIVYDSAAFDMPLGSPARKLPPGAGFAGFRVQGSRLGGRDDEWIAFLGASYFRTVGELNQYGISARGVAVNTAVANHSEEFPAFTRFYFEAPKRDDSDLTICALLEGPSIAGAYRFRLRRERAILVDVEAALFLRTDVERLGLAPLTSMYSYSETTKPTAIDWRPEVHDSDGLALWNGRGERIWRPLINPPQTTISAFLDKVPKGYGLLQRDRNFDHYLDGVHFERRPSVWVEPLESWGSGAVQLVEIPTEVETNDNIVAMWVPREPARAGANYRLRYRLIWAAEEPAPALARCTATRLGRGGQSAGAISTRFVVEFLGGLLTQLPDGLAPDASVGLSRGTVIYQEVEAMPNGVRGNWRVYFDVAARPGDPIELRVYLFSGERQLTETWLYRLNL
jgi:glucans biosynthesis protein